MKLLSATVTNYRSIDDSETFTVENGVTCLVGKNESGKTNVLQALYRLNPIRPARLDEDIDFPANNVRRRGDWGMGELVPVVEATFRYEPEEVEEIEDELGKGVLRSPEFTVTIGYRSKPRFVHDIDEAAVVEHLRDGLQLPAGPLAAVNATTTVEELLDALDGIAEPPSAVKQLIDRISSWRDEDVANYLVDRYARTMMPKFVYYADYDVMPGKASIPHLIKRRDEHALDRGEQALLSLLSIARVDPEDFHQREHHEQLIRALENAGNAISEEVFQYWSQNTDLEVQLTVLGTPEAGATPPLNQAPLLQVRVRNQRHKVTVPFDERSRGFVWFFSFLAYFSDLEDAEETDLILLMDEPGLSLHGRAQEDLLDLIDRRLASKHQVIYTTHSPFMVSPKHLDRVRTVVDLPKEGTKVSADVLKADNDTAFPLLAAMGIEMTQTLFVGTNTLLLEGPSDLIYLDVLSDAVEATGGDGLDPAWVKTPIGGAGKLSTFATLLGANNLNVAVLLDSSTQDSQAVKRLRDNGQLGDNGLVELNEFSGGRDADIEDLFDRDFYITLVNQAYTSALSSSPIALSDLNANDPRIVRQIETYFREHNIAGGKFNHYKPAAHLLREQATFLPLSAQTIEKARRLFARLNDLVRA